MGPVSSQLPWLKDYKMAAMSPSLGTGNHEKREQSHADRRPLRHKDTPMDGTHRASTSELWIWMYCSRQSPFFVSSKQWGGLTLIPMALLLLCRLNKCESYRQKHGCHRLGQRPGKGPLLAKRWSYLVTALNLAEKESDWSFSFCRRFGMQSQGWKQGSALRGV